MAPGPIAANAATIVGYKLSGISSVAVACIGVTLPSALLILIVGKLFVKYQEHPVVKAVSYGLRPTIISIIAFAAIKFAIGNGIIAGSNIIDIKSTIIMIAAFIILVKTKSHPALLIGASALIGIILF